MAEQQTTDQTNVDMSSKIEDELESEYKELTWEYLREIRRKRKRIEERKRKASETATNVNTTDSTKTSIQEDIADVTLRDGEVLPQYYGKCPDHLLGLPIEDLDPYYKERGVETFCVVTERFSNTYIYRFTATKAFFSFSPFNPIRRLAIRISSNQFFDYFVMLTIVINCVFLALDEEITESEYVFTAIYTSEMIVKILARGFVLSKFTYLRDLWNWLDFGVVILAYVTIITAATASGRNLNISGLRTFRVLRALKSFTIVPGLKTIVNALLQSLKPLGEVLVIMVFLVVVISLIALQAYQGVLLRKCVRVPTALDNITTDEQFNAFVINPENWNPVEGELQVCGNTSSSGICPAGYKCMQDVGENPNYGFTNFDHFGWAMLTSFQLLTLDYWENVYNMIIRAEGAWNVLFFFISVIFGPFYLLNLLLAVVTLAYSKEHEKQTKLRQMREKAKENARRRNKRRRLLMQRAKLREQSTLISNFTDAVELSINQSGQFSTNGNFESTIQSPTAVVSCDSISSLPPTNATMVTKDQNKSSFKGKDNQSHTSQVTSSKSTINQFSTANANENTNRQKFRDSKRNVSMESSESSSSQASKWRRSFTKCCGRFHKSCCTWTCHPSFVKLQKILMKVVCHKVFEGFIVFSILANTVFLALDHHEIDETFDYVLTVGNWVFTAIFTAEAAFKIIAMGLMNYLHNKWNIFDLIIVFISLLEFGLSANNGALSVLRTLRLMRVFRLARIWDTMRKLMSIILKSLSAVAYLTIVLFMVLFIFAVIGKQLYSQYYLNSQSKFGGEIPRWNFIDFYHSFLLVWRVMCGEWIEPLHDCMYLAGASCIPVFLLITFIANFLVLNLFTAILLEAFNVDDLKSKQVNQKTAKLKLGVETFKKLLKKSQSKSKSQSNTIAPQEKAEADDGDIISPDSPNPQEAEANTERRKSMSVANIFSLNLASQRRSQLGGYTSNGHRSRDQMTIFDLGKPTAEKKLGKQLSMSVDDGLQLQKEYHHPMTILEIENQDKSKSAHNVEEKEECFQVDEISHPKKVTFANDNSTQRRKRSLKRVSANQNLLQRIPWYKRCGSRCCGRKVESNDMETKDVKNEENSANDNMPDEESPYDEDEEQDVEEDSAKEAPYCLPQSLMCSCCPTVGDDGAWRTWNRFRYITFRFVEHKIFEWFILFIILASTVCLAMEDVYLKHDPVRQEVLNILEYIFTILFTIEMVLKWIGNGVSKYFTDYWCLIDFVIVVISWIAIGATAAGEVESLKSLRTLRALRPLRAISRWQGMRVVVNALVYCIPSIGNVLCVCMVIWLVFSIIGVQLFKGKFYRCEDADGNVLNTTVVANRTECFDKNYDWVTPQINFDNVVNGMIALFQVATFEGWIEVMSDASDTTGVYQQPSREAHLYAYIYFFFFVLIGSFFILNLIVGVIIESFQKLRKQTESSSAVEAFLTESQKNFYKTMRTMLNRKPKKSIPEPKNHLQLTVFKLVTHSRFEVAVFIVILLNMFTLAMEHYHMSDTWVRVLRYIDVGFTALFTLEAALKIFGTRFYYFRDAFNVFDFVVVLLSIIGFILEELLTLLVSPTLLRVVRVFRVFRVLRVIRAARGIRRLILTLMISLPALFNIAVLLAVFMLIFAILGMSFFMNVKLRGALNDIVNFRTFGSSMMLLFRLMTSAGWNDILNPLMNETDCEPEECGKKIIAIIYFVGYIFIVFLVVVNMYIAIILENFDEIFQQEETGVSQDDFEYFYVVWGRYDPKASQFVSIAELSNLLHSLHPPFQLAKPNEIKIAALNLPIVNGDKVHCLDVLFALVKRIMGEVEISDEMRKEAEERLLKSFPNRKTLKAETTTLALRQKVKAAKIIQEAWRGFHGKRRRGRESVSSDLFSFTSFEMEPISLPRPATMPASINTALLPPSTNEKRKLSVVPEMNAVNTEVVDAVVATQSGTDIPETSVQYKEDLSSKSIRESNATTSLVTKHHDVTAESVDVTPSGKETETPDTEISVVEIDENNILNNQNAGKTLKSRSDMWHVTAESLETQTAPVLFVKSHTSDEIEQEKQSTSTEYNDIRELDSLRPSLSLNVIRNDHVGEKETQLTHFKSPLKKQMNVDVEDLKKQAHKLPNHPSSDAQRSALIRAPPLNLSTVARSTEDEAKLKTLKKDLQSKQVPETKPLEGKDLKFNPQTGKFKAKTKTNDIELVSISRGPSAKHPKSPQGSSQQLHETKPDQSLIIQNNHLPNS